MKKKTISALATLATAAIIAIGSMITNQGGANIPEGSSVDSALSGNIKSNYTKPAASKEETHIETLLKVTFPSELIKSEQEGIVPFGYINALVTKVTDGDTFHIKYKDNEYKVRMLDIDTPESVKSGVEPQPFSEEASALSKEMLTDQKVKLIFEKDTTDQFDRLLAHVILDDETYYNGFMILNGYAISVFYSPNTLLKAYFNDLQDTAITEERGFWQLPESDRPFIKDSKGKYVAAYKSKGKAA